MATPVKYLVPYEVSVFAQDLSSGKNISNILYYQTQIATSGSPSYGSTVAGSSDLATFLTNFRASWRTMISVNLSVRYKAVNYQARAISGWGVGTPPKPVSGASNSTPIVISTPTPHGLSNGSQVTITGVLGNTNANGTWLVTVISATSFQLNGTTGNGAYAGGGTWSLVTPARRLAYSDVATLAGGAAADVGGVAGDAIALHTTASIQRRATTAGRNFRGGLRISPVAESDFVNGAYTPSRLTAAQTAMNTFYSTVLQNGGSDTSGSGQMVDLAVSKTLAFNLPTPFTSANAWTSRVTSYAVRPNNGSLVRRKPKLGAPIS